jgi:hypothetical protein
VEIGTNGRPFAIARELGTHGRPSTISRMEMLAQFIKHSRILSGRKGLPGQFGESDGRLERITRVALNSRPEGQVLLRTTTDNSLDINRTILRGSALVRISFNTFRLLNHSARCLLY